jgi:16S rRNA (uracil1498-N3)-methyltransferase
MRPYRLFISDQDFKKCQMALDPDLHRHLRKVLRLQSGAPLILVSETRVVHATLTQLSTHFLTFKLGEDVCVNHEPSVSITVAQALPKLDKLSEILRACTEIGVDRFIPLYTHRVDAPPLTSQRQIRWETILKSAAQQSQRIKIPALDPVMDITQLPTVSQDFDLKLVFWEEESVCFLSALMKDRFSSGLSLQSILVVIGPEGGLEASEVAFLQHHGFISVGLKMPILRVEHAALVAVSQFMALCPSS